MKLKPMADNVLLKAHEAQESTASGILLATSNKEKPAMYEVVSVGPGTKDEAMQVKVGDVVLYGKYAGTEVEIDRETVLIMRQSDILAILG